MLRKNLALATIVTAPSPATTGLSLVVDTGEAARFPVPATDGDFYATLFPANEIPHIGNAEIVKVTEVSTDTFTIVRAQRGSTAKTVEAGWLMIQGIYAEDFDDLATKAYVDNNPYGGWLTTGISGVTVTRQSTDNPTVVLRFDADVTDYIWKGMRIKATENSIVHYFIVSADPVYSAPNTDVTCLSEIDTTTPTQAKNLIGATTISDVAYAPPKTYPKGFPISSDSWMVISISNAQVQQSSPSAATWYNLGGNIVLPIGDWDYQPQAMVYFETNTTNNQYSDIEVTTSTSNNSESDADLTGKYGAGNNTSNVKSAKFMHTIGKFLKVTSKTTLYLNIRTERNFFSTLQISGTSTPVVIRATSTLL